MGVTAVMGRRRRTSLERAATPLLSIEDLWVAIPRYKLESQQVLRGSTSR